MKKLSWIGLIFGIAVFFSSCSPVYVPNVRNAALFRGAGEVQASGHFGNGLDAQAAVSVTNHIGVMGNYNYVSRNSETSDKYTRHEFWEGGVGYYENSEKICYEIFGGYGRGKGTTYDNYNDIFVGLNMDDIKATGKYQRFFIQPSIGSNHRIFNWIVSARISYVDFESFEYDGRTAMYNDPILFFEPAFTGRVNFGKAPIYSQFQAGFSVPTQGSNAYDYQPLTLSFGFGLRIGGLHNTSDREN